MTAPESIWGVWDTIAAALDSIMRDRSDEELLFLASDGVAEVNGIVADQARDELARREIAYH